MVGRRTRILHLLLVGGLAITLAGPVAPLALATSEGTAQDEIPRSYMRGIAVDDHWTFRITGDQRGEIHNEVVSEGFKRSDFFEERYPAYEIHASGFVETDELGPLGDARYDVRGKKWVHVSDYATIQVEGQSTIYNIDNSDAREAFEVPLVDLVHPFATGYEWVATSEWWAEPEGRPNGSQGFAMSVQQRVKVEGMETITVPAGTFDAWRLNYTSFRPGGGFALRWHVDEVCDFVREDSYDKDRTLKHRLELTDYSCTASEVAQPVYDIENVTLISRGVLGGPTGNEAPRPTGAQEPGDTAEAGGPGLWAALGVTLAAGLVLVASGRKRD